VVPKDRPGVRAARSAFNWVKLARLAAFGATVSTGRRSSYDG
jgi:hypothetical protein